MAERIRDGIAVAGRIRGAAVIVLAAHCAVAGAAEQIVETAKEIPVAFEADVVVVGGSGGAVACATAAARGGASVFLMAPRPYLGTDICGALRLWPADGERAESKLAAACFGTGRVATPYAVKAAMDRALLEAGVTYLTGCFATDVLRDGAGRVAGVVMANRSGRQAVRARVVVDASARAVVARLAGAGFRPFKPGPRTFRRVVIGGQLRSGEGVSGETKPFKCDSVAGGRKHRLAVHEYTLRIDMPDGGPRSWFRAENVARDRTWAKGAEAACETLYHVPTDTVVARERIDAWPGADRAPLDAFRPKGVAGLYVLGPHSDASPAAAAKLLRPKEWMAVGERLGQAAAAEASKRSAGRDATLPAEALEGGLAATVCEDLGGIRRSGLGSVRAGRRPLAVLGRYDVVVVGGGTSGAPAGIAAARSGAKTLVVEYLHELGGVGTAGLIAKYWRGLRRGFTAEVDKQVNTRRDAWNAPDKAEWLRRELRRSGAEVWLGVLGCGAVVDAGRVRGVVVATPWGRGAVLADVVIDATGNADVAAAAGAPTMYGISARGALNVQVAGFPDRPMRRSYVNTCYTIVDDTDVLDVWHLMAWKRLAAGDKLPAFDVGQLVDSRERRRIVGDYVLKTHDILNGRTFPDTISQHSSNFDAAAFPDAELLLLANAKGPDYRTDLPYRSLLPKGLDGILVVGLGCGADRDAMTLIRMQPDLQNQGYAAGVAAAAAADKDGRTREVDVKAVQRGLIGKGILDPRVATDRDSYPMGDGAISDAVKSVGKEADRAKLLRNLAIILAHRAKATPRLRACWGEAPDGPARLRYAQILGILGDAAGAATLAAAIDAHDGWDAGVPLTSQRKTGNTFSRLDRLVIALGYSRAASGVGPLLAKVKQLRPDSKLSHYKAISLALRHHRPCAAAGESLRDLLKHPGFAGHAVAGPLSSAPDRTPARRAAPRGRLVTQGRAGRNLNRAYRELIVAAMLHRCGEGDLAAAAILNRYAQDVHGHLARYAAAALAGTLFDGADRRE